MRLFKSLTHLKERKNILAINKYFQPIYHICHNFCEEDDRNNSSLLIKDVNINIRCIIFKNNE